MTRMKRDGEDQTQALAPILFIPPFIRVIRVPLATRINTP